MSSVRRNKGFSRLASSARCSRRLSVKLRLCAAASAKISAIMDQKNISTPDLRRMSRTLAQTDPEIAAALDGEVVREATGLELIPSENLVSEAVLEAMGSVLTNKYAEGYPGKRYYGGCEFADEVEQLAIDRSKALFGAEHANVQPHSGTQTNIAIYMTTLAPGDTVLGMNLAHGGHLTHGHPLNFSGKTYKFVPYGVSKIPRRSTTTNSA